MTRRQALVLWWVAMCGWAGMATSSVAWLLDPLFPVSRLARAVELVGTTLAVALVGYCAWGMVRTWRP